MMRTTRITCALAGAGLLAVALAGCGSSGQPSQTVVYSPGTIIEEVPPVLDAKFGQPYPVFTGASPTAPNCTVTVQSPTSARSIQYAFGPDHGWFVLFKVTFKANSNGVQPGGAHGFYVRGADGARYETSTGLGAGTGSSPTLDMVTLHAGESQSGLMTADVPAVHGTLVYTGGESGPSQVEWPF